MTCPCPRVNSLAKFKKVLRIDFTPSMVSRYRRRASLCLWRNRICSSSKWSKSANAQRLFLRSKRHFSRVWKVYFLCNVTVLAPILQGAHVMDFHLITFLWPGTFQDKSIQRSKKERTPNEKAFTRFCVPSYSAWELPMTGQRVILHSDLAPAPWNGVFDVSKVWSGPASEMCRTVEVEAYPITAHHCPRCRALLQWGSLFGSPFWQVVKPKVAARETKI